MANATQTIAGDVQLAGDIGGNNNAASPALVNTAVTPGTYTVAKLTVDSKGRLTAAEDGITAQVMPLIPDAITQTQYDALTQLQKEARGLSPKGIVKIGSGLAIDTGLLTLDAPWATESSKGIVQIGDGLVVTSGVVSFSYADATDTSKGLVQIGSGLSVTNGVVDLDAPIASKSVVGMVQIGDGIDVTGGVITVPDATTSTKGVVSIGSGLSVTGGVVSWTQPSYPDATTSTKGVVQIGDNINVSTGTISVPVGTDTVKGVMSVQSGGGLTITNGVLEFDGSYVDATYTTKGVVQIESGGGISVTGGVISTTWGTDATTSAKGIVQVGTNIDVSSGTISVKTGSATDKGVVQVGTNIDDSSGTISVATATDTVKGVVQVGTNIDVSSGTISVATATDAVKGVASFSDGLQVSTGVVSVDSTVARTNAANNFPKTVYSTASALTDGATISVDASLSNTFTITLGGNRTLANPTNLGTGSFTFVIKQDATGSRTLAFGTAYKFKNGFSKTLSTSGGATDVVSCISDGTNLYCTLSKGYA